jgi:hypothetical protein
MAYAMSRAASPSPRARRAVDKIQTLSIMPMPPIPWGGCSHYACQCRPVKRHRKCWRGLGEVTCVWRGSRPSADTLMRCVVTTIKNPIPRSESSIQLTRLQLGVVARPCSSKPALVPVRVDRLAEVGIIFFIRQRLSKDSLLLI